MSARRLLIYVVVGFGALMVVVVGVLVFIVPTVDADYYRPLIERKATALAGREVRIGGALQLRWSSGLSVLVSASDIRVANPSWSETPHALHIARVDIEIVLPSLLRHVVRIERLHVEQPIVVIETSAAGANNWARARPDQRSADRADWVLALDDVSLSDVDVQFRGKTGRRYHATFTRLTGSRDATTFNLDGRGAVDRHAVSFRISARPSVSRVELTLAATFDEGSMTATGVFAAPVGVSALRLVVQSIDTLNKGVVDISVSVDGDDVAALARNFGWELPAIGSYRVAGRLHGALSQLSLREVRFQAGSDDIASISGQGEIDDVARRRSMVFDVKARVAQPERLRQWLGATAARLPPPIILAGKVTRQGRKIDMNVDALTLGTASFTGRVGFETTSARPKISATMRAAQVDLAALGIRKRSASPAASPLRQRLQSTRPFNVGWMQEFDADIGLKVDALRLPTGTSVFGVSIRLRLHRGRAIFAPLLVRFEPRSPPTAGSVTLQARTDGVYVRADVAGTSIPLTALLASLGSSVEVDGAPTQLDIALESSGRSVRELIERLDGAVSVFIGGGRFESDKIEFGARLLTRLFDLVRPKTKRHAELICAALYVPIRNGSASFDRNIALHTSNVKIVGSGVVDFRDSDLDMYLYTRATEGWGVEAGKLTNMLKIHGTLSDPSISVNPEGVMKSAISIGAAAVTGGASLLVEGMAKRAASDEQPCDTALSSGRTPP